MKKVFSSLFFALMLPFVSAASDFSFGGISSSFIESAKDLFSPFFEAILNTSSFNEFFFAKILVLFLLFIVIYAVLNKIELFKKTKGVASVVSAIVSILAVRFMSEDSFFEGVLLPYGALGVSIVTFIPFLIYFWFTHKSVSGGFGRRIGWAIYFVVFLIMWGMRSSDISGASDLIYLLGLLAVGVSFIFDGTIHSYFSLGDLNSNISKINDSRVAHLLADYNHLSRNLPESSFKDERLRELREQIKKAGGKIPE